MPQHETDSHDGAEPNRSESRPTLQMIGRNRSARDFCTELYAVLKDVGGFYQRGGQICTLVERDDNPVLEILTPAMAVTAFEKEIEFVQTRKDGGMDTLSLREDQARIVLASEARCSLPCIETVTQCPVLAENQEGELTYYNYDYVPSLRMFITGRQSVPEISSAAGVKRLLALIQHYQFAAPSDKSRAVAALLTPALKQGGFIRGHVPIVVIEANKQQSGKSKLAESIASIYGAKAESISQQVGGVGSTDERIATAMLKGNPFVLLDNWRGSLDSALLESALTCTGTFQVRTPGKPAIGVDASKFFFVLTSNGLASTPDLMERAVITRVLNRPGYNFPQHPEGSLPAHVLAHHLDYLAAVYAVIIEWHHKGRPKSEEPRHSFREWAQPLDWIVQNLFSLPPILDDQDEAKKRTQEPSLAILRQLCLASERTSRLGEKMQASDLADIAEECGIDIGVGRRTDERAGAKQIGTIMSRAFRSLTDSNEDEAQIERFEGFYIRRKRIKVLRSDRHEFFPSWAYCLDKKSIAQMPGSEDDWEGKCHEEEQPNGQRRGRNPMPKV